MVDERPWGRFRPYPHNETCMVKLIDVNARATLHLQRHVGRDELWVVLDDGLEARIAERTVMAAGADEVLISRRAVRGIGGGEHGGLCFEMAFGDFDEGNVERLEDAPTVEIDGRLPLGS